MILGQHLLGNIRLLSRRSATPMSQLLTQGFFHNRTPAAIAQPLEHRYSTKSTNLIVPNLPILEKMADCVISKGFQNQSGTLVVGIQHMLPTTASLFNYFIKLGVQPRNMYFAGKFYSSHPGSERYIEDCGINLMPTKTPRKPWQFDEQMKDTIDSMWKLVERRLKNAHDIERVIILDEGGYCVDKIPAWIYYKFPCAAIEQTRYGFYNDAQSLKLFDTIDVARSAAKRKLESPLIARAVLRRIAPLLKEIDVSSETVFGVAGNGAIGSSVANYLLSLGYTVNIYDENELAFQSVVHGNCYRVGSVASLIHSSDVIFGCTGRDITKSNNVISLIKKPTVLASCSSQAIEYESLLKSGDGHNSTSSRSENFSHLTIYSTSGSPIKIVESGFPINFDRTPLSDPVQDMELTRGLLFGSFVQAVLSAKKPKSDGVTLNRGSIKMLDPAIQRFVVNNWKDNVTTASYHTDELKPFNKPAWIKGHSSGEYSTNTFISDSFNTNTHQTNNTDSDYHTNTTAKKCPC